jgi:hypothetical protein
VKKISLVFILQLTVFDLLWAFLSIVIDSFGVGERYYEVERSIYRIFRVPIEAVILSLIGMPFWYYLYGIVKPIGIIYLVLYILSVIGFIVAILSILRQVGWLQYPNWSLLSALSYWCVMQLLFVGTAELIMAIDSVFILKYSSIILTGAILLLILFSEIKQRRKTPPKVRYEKKMEKNIGG